MYRKQKLRILLIFITFAIIPIPIVLNLLFAQQLLAATYVSNLFLIPCLFICCTKVGRHKIGDDQEKSNLVWIFKILGIEAAALALFITQQQLLKNYLAYTAPNNHFSLITTLTMVISHWGLYPWSLFCFFGMIIALYNTEQERYSPFTHFFSKNSPRIVIEHLLQFATKVFLVINGLFIVLLLTYYLNPQPLFFAPLNGMLIATILMLLPRSQMITALTQVIENKQLQQGIYLLIIMTFSFIISFLATYVISFVSHAGKLTVDFAIPQLMQSQIHLKTYPQLWNWGWWILGTPLIGSLLLKASHGKSVRSFVLGTLLLPALLFLVKNNDVFISIISKYNSALYFWSALLSGIFLLVLLLYKKNSELLWSGFFTLYPHRKAHRNNPLQFWFMWASFLGLFFITSIVGLQLLGSILMFYLYLIFMLQLLSTKLWKG